MKRFITIACLFSASILSCVASDSPSPEPASTLERTGEWSQTVNQLRGRLVVEYIRKPNGVDRVEVYCDLQNLRTDSFPLGILYSTGKITHWELIDEKGQSMPLLTDIPGFQFEGGGMSEEHWLIIPFRSTLRLFLSPGGYESYPQTDKLGFRMNYDSSTAGPLAVPTDAAMKSYLSVQFQDIDKNAKAPEILSRWSGTLVLPKVELPLRTK